MEIRTYPVYFSNNSGYKQNKNKKEPKKNIKKEEEEKKFVDTFERKNKED